MTKLFQVELPFQAFVNEPGDLVATISYDGAYQIQTTLPQGSMGFQGANEAELKKDILKALRAMAQQAIVPDLALEVLAEILTDLPDAIEHINAEMEEATKATPKDALSEFWGTIFPGGIEEIGQPTPAPVAQAPEQQPEESDWVQTPFGRFRLISTSLEELPEGLREALGALLSGQPDEAKEETQTTPKFYS